MALTRRQATKAGKVLQRCAPDSPECQEALEVMRQWRGQHVEPTQESFRRLLEVSRSIPESVASYRLKRQASILAKLRRGGSSFELGAIDDLGGCRLIVEDMAQVDAACKRIRDVFPDIKQEKDRIEKPEKSGYRSHHVIVQIPADEGKGRLLYRVEIQVRTRLQHYWATAVEAAGEIYGLDLKTPKPDADATGKERSIRDFFKAASAAFALEEGTPAPEGYIGMDGDSLAEAIRSKNDFMTILNDLEASTDTVFPMPGIPDVRVQGAGLYLLQFSRTEQILNMGMFPVGSLDAALRAYQRAEDTTMSGEPTAFDNVVLVYAQNPDQLRLAYPNYSSNVQEFVTHMKNFTQ